MNQLDDQEWGMQPRKSEPANTQWMLTFADLLSLMLTFFVLLFSMASVEQGKWAALTSSLTERLNPDHISAEKNITKSADFNINREGVRTRTDLRYIESILQDRLANQIAADELHIELKRDRITLHLKGQKLFQRDDAYPFIDDSGQLEQIAEIIAVINQRVEVLGHSGKDAPKTGAYKSNWALSLARARAIALLLQSYGYQHEISAIGYGDSKFGSFMAGYDDALREEAADRIEIVIHRERSRY